MRHLIVVKWTDSQVPGRKRNLLISSRSGLSQCAQQHLLSCAVQVACAHHLREVTRKEVAGRAKLGVAAFAEALLGVPKTLAENSGYDAQVGAPRGCRRAALKHRPSGSH